MRVTDSQVYSSILRNLSKSQQDYHRAHEIAASGKKINRPSDDPESTGRVLRIREQIASIEQYEKNAGEAATFQEHVEINLNLVSELLASAKAIAISADNGTEPPETMDLMADEVHSLRDQMIAQANAEVNGRYLFGGYDSASAPFDATGAYQGDSGEIEVRISETQTVTLNTPGDQVFGPAGGVDLFQVLSDLETGLRNHDPDAVRATEPGLDAARAQISAARAASGFRAKQVETASAVLARLKLNLNSLVSQAEDADMAEALVRLSYQELVLQSVMETSSKLLQTNLLSFLD